MFFEQIRNVLQNNGFDVYSIGQHTGTCKNPYVVIKENGQSRHAGLPINNELIDIIVFYPLGSYSQVMPYLKKADKCIRSIKELKPTHIITPVIVDNEKKAYTASIQYQIYKRRD